MMVIYNMPNSHDQRHINWFNKRYAKLGLTTPRSNDHTIFYDIKLNSDRGHLMLVKASPVIASNLTAIVKPYDQQNASRSFCYQGRVSGDWLHYVRVFNPDRLSFNVYDCLMLINSQALVINWSVMKVKSND